jgi:hypothetical protein
MTLIDPNTLPDGYAYPLPLQVPIFDEDGDLGWLTLPDVYVWGIANVALDPATYPGSEATYQTNSWLPVELMELSDAAMALYEHYAPDFADSEHEQAASGFGTVTVIDQSGGAV